MTMPRRLPAWSAAMQELLADGEWHPYEQVIRVGMARVPPATAIASYRRDVSNRHTGLAPGQVKAQKVSDRIRDGRWELCRRIVSGWHRRGFVLLDPPERAAPGKRVKWNRPL